ncbi:tripartite tricarboxylate transporter TctB family protein [Amycolatopsis albispora]|uniref:DUF1468 domain-containing protein n=1 Tax=Amycolatopsis albispora TaxID=1804986 RepID=A0A344L097_9PSEU|nr:tripartite tricarboxylate transporter TctB family protein [Amycolatopsis albispora]AXB41471.1 hypothetical protein A4R43_02135 [Amycolatopsis albispora]
MTTTDSGGYLRRRTGLVVPVLLLCTGIALTAGTLTMEVPSSAAAPGPRLFPAVVAVACVVFAVLLGIDVLRRPEPAETGDGDKTRIRSNHRALAGAVGTLVVFIAALDPLGWLLSGALLFWGVARALGSRRPAFDAVLSIAISSAVQLAFSAGLGLNLPPGLLAGVF